MALDGFEGGFRIGGHLVTNLRHADDIVLITGTRIKRSRSRSGGES